jgi:hypothetical protein
VNAAGLSADNDTIIGSSANDVIMGGAGMTACPVAAAMM